jgi:hypothetical protein
MGIDSIDTGAPQGRVKSEHPGSLSLAREIWHADFLIDSSVFSQAALDRRLYDRLARQIHKMTARDEYGRAWIPWTAFEEMAATPDPKRRDVLGVLVNLHRELEDRILLTGDLEHVIAGEWSDPPHSASLSLGQLDGDLLACVRGNGAGTILDAHGHGFTNWRKQRHEDYEAKTEKWRSKYFENENTRRALAMALENVRHPEIFEFCDDIAGQLIEQFAKREKEEGLKLAKATQENYLSTWTFALLVRIAQFAQTLPTAERAKGPFGAYARLLKPDENDTIDATIAALGARCGFLITEDGVMRERINFLHGRKVCRLQAMGFSDIEANWHPPNQPPDA